MVDHNSLAVESTPLLHREAKSLVMGTGDSEGTQNGRAVEDFDPRTLGGTQYLGGRLDHFTWPWFACCMSTASLAVVLGQQPYTFHGLRTIGKIFFILDLVLFLSFTIAIAIRFVRTPSKFYRSLHRPQEALFFGSYWVSLALLLTCTQLYGVPATGPWLVKTLQVLFWLYASLALLVAIFQYSTIFIAEQVSVATVMPAWIFPVYPILVIGPLASVLIPSQPYESAFDIFVGGVLFQGLAWCISVFMYTVYIIRLMSSELPPPPVRPGMYVGVGPAGYTSAALVGLANQAQSIVPPGFLGLSNFDVGASIKVVGILAGIFVWLLSFWFCALSTVAVLSGIRKMRFTLNWWAFVFPNAGMTLAAIQIGNALDSPGIKAVTSAATIILVILWFFVAGAHIIAVTRKTILWPGNDEDTDTDK